MRLGPKLKSYHHQTCLKIFRNTQPVRDSFNNEASQPPSSGFISVVVLTSEKARVAAVSSIKVTNYSLVGPWSLQTMDLFSPSPYIKKS